VLFVVEEEEVEGRGLAERFSYFFLLPRLIETGRFPLSISRLFFRLILIFRISGTSL
jgi:hypothetical protein